MQRKQGLLILFLLSVHARGQEKSDMQQIMERLERLEQQNRALAAEVHALRDELTARGTPVQPVLPPGVETAPPEQAPLDERVAVEEQRTTDMQQSKVESSQKFPISITGMVLFNAFLNGKAAGNEYPTLAALTSTSNVGGATLAQSVLGLKYQGPHVFGGGQVNGSLFMDFFGGTNQSLNHLLRIRVASVEIDWKDQTFMVGQDKPIISPREPNSLAQVGVSPLTATGNLWLWAPQARFEQRFRFGEETGLRAQIGVYQTNENYRGAPSEYDGSISSTRPGLEGRFELWHNFGRGRRIELAPGFHISSSHVGAESIPSRIFSFDWLIRPWSRLDFTGMFFDGENVGTVGGLQQGIFFGLNGYLRPVHATGGWGQVSYRATQRLSFNVFGGEEDDRNSDVVAGGIARNLAYAGNIVYRLGPNVLVGLEASQLRTTYLGPGLRLNNHYDLALAYLF